MRPAPASSPAPAAPEPAPSSVLAVGGLLLGFVAIFCARLWPEWKNNPDLSHGFFAPLVFVLLLRESRREGPPGWLPASFALRLTLAGTLTAGFVLFALAGLLAASVAWTHALVLFVLAASLVCFLFGGLLILADERVRVQPFNWISVTAIFLWLLAAPLPDGTYARLTVGLQGWVTSAVLETLHVFGIPARQHGNVIELATTSVGVAEACSGIRSLLSCIYAGFFFAAWQLRRTAGRLLLIIVAPLLALGMNFLRSLVLTLLANAGKDITGFWHDVTGFAILAITAAVLAGLAILLETPAGPRAEPIPAAPSRPPRGSLRFFGASVTATLALGTFYFVSAQPATRAGQPVPNLAALLPAQPAGWDVVTSKELYQFADVLQTTHLMERTYLRTTSNGQLRQLNVYVAYWPAGQATVSRVASHTPDACWPGAGWSAQTVPDRQQVLQLPGLQSAPAEHRRFQNAAGFPQHVWFWHIYDGRPINYRDPYSVPALLQLALHYGFRRQGDQYFVRVTSNEPWGEIAGDPLVREILSRLKGTGL